MLPSRRVTVVLTWVAMGCAVQQSNAAMAGYQITGAVTYVTRGPSCPVDPLITVGTPMQGTLLYDLAAPDLDPGPIRGRYRPEGQFILQIGSLTIDGSDAFGVSVADNEVGGDDIGAGGVELLVEGYRISQFFLAVDGPTTLLPSDSLPATPIDLTQATLSSFVIIGGSSSSDFIKITGITQEWVLIPEPSMMIGMTGLTAVCLWRHRRR